MKRNAISLVAFIFLFVVSCGSDNSEVSEVPIKKDVLMDKIKGGWAGQMIGCTYGGITEFRFQGTMIQDYVPIKYDDHCIKWWYDNAPGLYDDVYMDLTFVKVFQEKGLDAPVSAFANAFANAEYPLWHANQAARYNILNGIHAPNSGFWENNPHSDDIDFQIEADYAGLMSPGMINTAVSYTDSIGHIMNYGNGWYGGVYIAAMYALAFVNNDVDFIVNEALKVIPKESSFYKCMLDVIRWHDAYPDDWKQNWAECQKKWSTDIACPDGIFVPFNIDAVINSAYCLIGLLYGEGDFFRTIDITTRCGQDSDCNPATVAGILGTIYGYSGIPERWIKSLKEIEDIALEYTDISLNDAYEMSFSQAIEVIKRNGGEVADDYVIIKTQAPKSVRLEQGFPSLWPVDRISIDKSLFARSVSFNFSGTGIIIAYDMNFKESGYIGMVDIRIDNKIVEEVLLPDSFRTRKLELYSNFKLEDKEHVVEIEWKNKKEGRDIHVSNAFIYEMRENNQ